MPSRTPSDASAQPRGAKFSSSIQPHQLKIAKSFKTSELAHQQALTAAELAFERARERTAAQKGTGNADGTSNAFFFSEGPQLGRRQSIRFTGSNAIKTRELPQTRREAPEHHNGLDLHNTPSQSFHEQRSSGLKRSALPLQSPGCIESNIASEPSSYRKLRKAKSMFMPRRSPSIVSTKGTPTSRTHFKRHSMHSTDSHNDRPMLPDRRLRRSFSFLHGVTDRLPTGNRQYVTNDAAIQIARDQYLRQLEVQRLKEQPSFLSLRRRCKTPKQFRRTVRTTVRTSSGNSYGSAIQSPLLPAEPGTPKRLGKKVRTVSQTLRKAIRKVFAHKAPNDASIPAQHLPATKPHYGQDSVKADDEHPYPPIPSPDIELLRRVDSRASILRDTPVNDDKEAHIGSIRSVSTETDDTNHQSRVTSWTNSTTANTINMPQFIERKRLSIIREDGGPHQPSSSVGPCMDTTDGYAAFRQPVMLDNASPASAQRIYSALQREIRKSNQHTGLDDSVSSIDSNSDQMSSRQTRGTLRRVSSGPIPMEILNAHGSQSHELYSSRPVIVNPPPMVAANDSFVCPDRRRSLYERDYVPRVARLTPQQIADINESELLLQKRPLREVKSAFFPSESRIERSTTSPYRRAKYDASEDLSQTEDEFGITKSNGWSNTSPFLGSSFRSCNTAISESVYSRTSGGHSPKARGSSVSIPKSESSGEVGTAVIITSVPQSSTRAGKSTFQHRKASDKSSGEWKRWMASEVSYFEDNSPEVDGIYNALPAYQSCHRRENAQLDGEEVGIGRSPNLQHSAKQPLGILQANFNPHSVLQQRHPPTTAEKIQYLHGETSENSETFPQKENTPKVLSQVGSNMQIALESEKGAPTVVGGLRRKSSQTLNSRNEIKDSSPSVHGRNNPERIERLRRLQSKSLQPLTKTSNSPKTPSRTNEIVAAAEPSLPNARPEKMTLDDADQSFNAPENQVVSSQAMVGQFLRSRRSQMRISEASGGDPAFI